MEANKMTVLVIVLAVALVLFSAFGSAPAYSKSRMQELRDKYGRYAIQFGVMYGIPFDVILAIIAQESNGNPNAKGTSGERGLMQLMPAALSDVNARFGTGFSFEDMYVPEKNIQAGVAYLAICRNFFYGSMQKAIQAYNAGMGNVQKNPNASIAYYNSVEAKRLLV